MGLCASGAAAVDVQDGEDNTPPPPMPPEVSNKYTIGKKLGDGLSGVVYFCTEKSSGENFAIKCCSMKGLDQRDKDNLKTEVEMIKKCKHPNILRYCWHHATAEYFYIVTELIAGGELFDSIVANSSYCEEDAKGVIRTLLKTVQYLHSLNIVHRDLKAENIMLVSEATDSPIKVVDFGMAMIVPDDLTGITEGAGTPGYLAPEVLVVSPNYSKPSDVWAIGVVAYVLLAGVTPFYGDTDDELFAMIRKGVVEPGGDGEETFPDEYFEKISKNAIDFMKKAWVVDPARRPTCSDLLQHPWISDGQINDTAISDAQLKKTQQRIRQMQAKKRFQNAINAVIVTNRMHKLLCVVRADANGKLSLQPVRAAANGSDDPRAGK